jgi:hypothetical protein
MVRSARNVGLVMIIGSLLSLVLPPVAAETTAGLEELLGSRTPGGWMELSVDTTRDVGTYVSVAVNPISGAPFIAYYEQAAGDLWFAHHVGAGGTGANCGPGTTWHCQQVDSAGDVGRYNSIAVHPLAGNQVKTIIAYYDLTNGSLKVAQATCEDSCSFAVTTAHSGSLPIFRHGLYTSVAYSASGVPWIASQTTSTTGNEHAGITTWVGSGGNCGSGAWQCDSITNGPSLGLYDSIDFDALGRPHVAFYDDGANMPWYAVRIGSGGNCGPSNSWLCQSVELSSFDTGRSTSLFVEPDGSPHLAYVNVTNHELIHATHVGSGGNCGFSSLTLQWEWQCDVIDDDIGAVGTGRTVAIAGDPDGNPMIAYQDVSDDLAPASLRFAQPYAAAPAGAVPNCGPYVNPFYTWVCTMLDNGGTWVDEGAALAMASDPTGSVVAYYEADSYYLKGNLKVQWVEYPFFEDGFETGSWSRWSSAQP